MARLITAIISTLIWEAAIVVVGLWGLPLLGVQLNPAVIAGAVGGFAVYAVVSYRIGTRAFRRKALVGMSDMTGSRGRVVERLKPDGMVLIGSELWKARSLEGNLDKGQAVAVEKQDGFKLYVRKSDKSCGATR